MIKTLFCLVIHLYREMKSIPNKYILQRKLPSEGYQNKLEALIIDIEKEIKRRSSLQEEKYQRKAYISSNYERLHKDILAINEKNRNDINIFHPKFLKLQDDIETKKISNIEVKNALETHPNRVFTFPLFTNEFCFKLLEEIKHFETSEMPKGRPNTMNRYGVNLDELGFNNFISDLRKKYLIPLTKIIFPDWGGSDLDSHKAFIVAYRKGEDVDLGYHFDNAEITLNVSLNDHYEEGELVFGPMRSMESSVRYGYKHQKGFGVLHRGQQLHQALPISEGERYNLIIWMRSSDIRNKQCPMCNSVPTLMLDDKGMGDGFTQNFVNICTAL